MRHLQRLSPFDEDAVLGAHAGPHHHGRGGGQSQRAGAGDAQHRDGGLEGKADYHLGRGNALTVTLATEVCFSNRRNRTIETTRSTTQCLCC